MIVVSWKYTKKKKKSFSKGQAAAKRSYGGRIF